ncbi:MAG: hypothetical protein ACD_73C00741G0001, partial [uncultured bacterium]
MKKNLFLLFFVLLAFSRTSYALQIINNFGSQGYAYGNTGDEGFVDGFSSVNKIITLSNRAGQILLSRYNYGGRLDSTFGSDGRNFVPLADGSASGKVIVKFANNDNFYVGGVVTRNGDDDIFIAAFRADGTLKNDFGTNGLVIVSHIGPDSLKDLYPYGDGRIMFVGNYGPNIAVGRFDAAGRPDLAVNRDGVYATNIAFSPVKIAMSPNLDQLLIAGTINNHAAIARYTANNLRPDLAFGQSGFLEIRPAGINQSRLNQLIFQFDGKMVATGVADNRLIVIRLNANGSLDLQFDNDGYVFPALPAQNHVVKYITPMFDGRLFIVTDNTRDLYFMQLTTSGNFDARYGNRLGFINFVPMAPLSISRVINTGNRLIIVASNSVAGQPVLAYFDNESCGNGNVGYNEDCDDANLVNGDGCDNACQLATELANCGNGVAQLPEQCDDGDQDATDVCTNNCRLPRCGDGIVSFSRGENCDDGNMVNLDGCSAACVRENYCGNGVWNQGEICDDG